MEIRLSVRGLVEFVLRSGDIDNRIHQVSADAMQEGGRIHRAIQSSMGPDYHAEVPLFYQKSYDGYDLIIEGRADGILTRPEDRPDMIDEIKGTYRDLAKMKEPVPVHLAQARCYAAMYLESKGDAQNTGQDGNAVNASGSQNTISCVQQKYKSIDVRMTYCNMDTEEKRYYNYSYTREETMEWFMQVLDKYSRWADFQCRWEKERQSSIKLTEFPYPYREGQRDLAAAVYRTIVHKKKLFLEAPTGTGKTLSTVFPTVKAMGEGKISRIFYLTAKTIARTVAEEAFGILRSSQGLRLKSVTITARDGICFLSEEARDCNPVACPYARGHYDRVNDAIYDLLTSEDDFNREKICEYAKKHLVCPFEMSLDMSLFADAIICDYNYVFDPFVYLRRFFADGARHDYAFLVDESHNLLDRGREMYSAQLSKESFLTLKRKIKDYHGKIAGLLDKCNKAFLELKRECSSLKVYDSIGNLTMSLERLSSTVSEYLEDHEDGLFREDILEFYFEVSRFLTISELVDDKYVIYGEIAGDGDFYVRLFCVDPSRNLAMCMDRALSTILFSATLLPIQYYKSLLGGKAEDFEIYAKSVFDPAKMGIFIASDVSSRYQQRGDEMYRRIASCIDSIVRARSGNYLVFFPSHQFLGDVYDVYREQFNSDLDVEVLLQGSYMTEEAREAFLSRFTVGNDLDLGSVINMDIEVTEDKSILGFCVMGGIFGEGIDLKYDSLIGVIIVGTGLPMVCNERELLRDYFENRGVDGFDYAYRYPGMNKVLQAAGRVIRTVDDVGVVALLDDRFLSNSYRSLFPREWKGAKIVSTRMVKNAVTRFWSGN